MKTIQAINQHKMDNIFTSYIDSHRNSMMVVKLKITSKNNSFDLECLKVNNAFEQIFNITKEKIEETRCKSLFFDFINLDVSTIKDAIQNKSSICIECENLKLKKFFRVYLSPIGKNTALCEFEDFQVFTSSLSSFAQDSDDLLWTIDTQFNITFVNNSIFNFFGVQPAEITGKNLLHDFKTETLGNFIDQIKEQVNLWKENPLKSITSSIEFRTNHLNGNEIWLETHFSPIIFHQEKIVGFKGISRNITLKKETEHQLLQSQVKYKNLVDLLPEIIFEFNLNLRFTFFNKSALDILGYNIQDLEKGIYLEDILSAVDVDRVKKSINSLEDNISNHRIFKVFKKDQTKINVAIYYNTIKLKNKIVGARGIGIDITSHKNIETKLLKAKQKLKEAGKLKTTFLANMSHEIRTPMNSILGYTQLLQKKEKEPHKIQFLDTIYVNSKRLLNLLNDIIDISKLESGELDVLYEKIDIKGLMSQLNKEYSLEIKQLKKDIDLIFKLDSIHRLNPLICDGFRLKQVLQVLFNNALKFTDTGFIEIGCTQLDEKQVLFYVKDTGIGLTENHYETIFNAFEQANDQIASKYGGSGIGLTLAKGVVSSLHGNIWVESKINTGSTFYFTLPFDPNEYENIYQENQIEELVLEGKNILIVEDDENNAIFLNEVLKEYGAKVLHAGDSRKAVQLFKENKIDCVLMDIQLPGVDGYEITRMLKQINQNIPVIAQTAFAMPHERKKCYDAGCDDYISKPIDQEEMIRKIKTLTTTDLLSSPQIKYDR